MVRNLNIFVILLFLYCQVDAKGSDEKNNASEEIKFNRQDSGALMFADELRQTLEKYLLGICPQPFKSRWSAMVGEKRKNSTVSCDLDYDQRDLAGRLATLALRAHSASRTDCLRFGAALANTLGELARTAASTNVASAANDNKKRKLSKSQKAKIQAKQRTALAVKKKAAAVAAAAAAKMTS